MHGVLVGPIPITLQSDAELSKDIKDSAIQHDERLVFVGTPHTNAWLAPTTLELPTASYDRLFARSSMASEGAGHAIVSIVPEPASVRSGQGKSALVISAPQDLMIWLMRLVVDAGSDLPDFVVFGPELAESAARALLLAGHWDVDWTIHPHLIGGPLASCPVQTKMGPQDGTVFCR